MCSFSRCRFKYIFKVVNVIKYIIPLVVLILGIGYCKIEIYKLESEIKTLKSVLKSRDNKIAELQVEKSNLIQDKIIKEELEKRLNYEDIFKDVNVSNGYSIYF